MAKKFGRNYELTITVPPLLPVVVTPPFTVEFDITRSTLSSANRAMFRIYNLSEKTRNILRKNVTDFGAHIPLQFRAGYGDDLSLGFKGNVTQGYSYRDGVNFITQLECYDGGTAFMTGKTNQVFPAGTPTQDVLRTLIGTLPFVSPGVVGDFPGTLTRGMSLSGNTADLLREFSGGGFFIDCEKAHVLNADEYISDYTPMTRIDASTGLIGTPQLENTLCRFDMVFEPRLVVGQRITLSSITGAGFNGDYKATAVQHRGMISDAVAGTVVTTGEFFYFKSLKGVSAF